jgi:hypothetical protein
MPWAVIEAQGESTDTLIALRAFDFTTPLLSGIAFFICFLAVVGITRARLPGLIVPLVIVLLGGGVLFLLAWEILAYSPTPFVGTLSMSSLEHPEWDYQKRFPEWSEQGSVEVGRFSIPVQAKYEQDHARYTVNNGQFDWSVRVPHGEMLHALAESTRFRPRVPAYTAAGLAGVLLLLAALQICLILARPNPEPVPSADSGTTQHRAEAAGARRGRVNSFFGEIYSLMFESRR